MYPHTAPAQRTFLESLCADAQLGSPTLPFPYAAADKATRARIIRGAALADVVIGVTPGGTSTVLKGGNIAWRMVADEIVPPFSYVYLTLPSARSARALLRTFNARPEAETVN